MDTAKTLHLLETEEGFRPVPYTDSTGHSTIGIGYNLASRPRPSWWDGKAPWSYIQAMQQLQSDVLAICKEMDIRWPKWRTMADARQAICISGIYQLGISGAAKFHDTIQAIEAGDFQAAADHMAASLWAHQTPHRADRAEKMMLTGEWLPS